MAATLLALYKRPEGGDEALEMFWRRYREEHMPLIEKVPGLRGTKIWNVAKALCRRGSRGDGRDVLRRSGRA